MQNKTFLDVKPMWMPPLPYSLTILRRDPHRYAPAILAVAFSAVLIAVQCGLVLGVLQCVSVFIDGASADIWVMTADADSPPQACPIPLTWQLRLDMQPEIERTEPYLLGPGAWHKPHMGSIEECFIVGFHLDDPSLGRINAIPPDLLTQLSEPGTIVVDRWDLENLGLNKGTGEAGELNQKRVRVVGTVSGFRGHNFIFIFCSLQTARMLLPAFHEGNHLTMCVLALPEAGAGRARGAPPARTIPRYGRLPKPRALESGAVLLAVSLHRRYGASVHGGAGDAGRLRGDGANPERRGAGGARASTRSWTPWASRAPG